MPGSTLHIGRMLSHTDCMGVILDHFAVLAALLHQRVDADNAAVCGRVHLGDTVRVFWHIL